MAFDFFLKELIRVRRERALSRIDEHTVALPEWAWQLLGYALFVWSSLGLITLGATAPDMLVSVFVYLALAQVLRISRGAQSRWSFFILGLILGIGYLAKAPMLPLSVVFLLVGIFWVGAAQKAVPRVLATMLGLLLVAGCASKCAENQVLFHAIERFGNRFRRVQSGTEFLDVTRQFVCGNGLTRTENRSREHNIAQLTHVAAPVIVL